MLSDIRGEMETEIFDLFLVCLNDSVTGGDNRVKLCNAIQRWNDRYRIVKINYDPGIGEDINAPVYEVIHRFLYENDQNGVPIRNNIPLSSKSKFIPYLAVSLRNEVNNLYSKEKPFSISQRQKDKARNVLCELKKIELLKGRAPTVQEISDIVSRYYDNKSDYNRVINSISYNKYGGISLCDKESGDLSAGSADNRYNISQEEIELNKANMYILKNALQKALEEFGKDKASCMKKLFTAYCCRCRMVDFKILKPVLDGKILYEYEKFDIIPNDGDIYLEGKNIKPESAASGASRMWNDLEIKLKEKIREITDYDIFKQNMEV